jgi:hypothetical protein
MAISPVDVQYHRTGSWVPKNPPDYLCLWPVAEGCDFRKQDTQATAIGKSRRSLAASAPDPDKPLTISHLQSFEAFIPEHLEKFEFFILS